jgi:hypothetical protein
VIINFRQGIISYPASPLQQFLEREGTYYNLKATVNEPTILSFAYGSENYTFDEIANVTHAWGPVPLSGEAWLYWNLDLLTAVRTFGFTRYEPVVSLTAPISPPVDQHWFDLNDYRVKVWNGTSWVDRIRVFAAKINNTDILPYGNNTLAPFAGSQIGVTGPTISANTSHILFDRNSKPIITQDGLFVTTGDQFFIQGSSVNNITIESTVLRFAAASIIPKYHVVKVLQDGTITAATYNDLSNTFICMSTEGLAIDQVGSFVSQGVITNTEWNWTTPGQALWIDEAGSLTTENLGATAPLSHPDAKPPVARVINQTTVFFDQGLGGRGSQGPRGESGESVTVVKATNLVAGIAKLSVPAVTSSDPIAVGTNDPRLSDQRAPLAHTHTATQVLPSPINGTYNGSTLQLMLGQIVANKVDKAGDTMTGNLTVTQPGFQSIALTSDTLTLSGLAVTRGVLPTAKLQWNETIPAWTINTQAYGVSPIATLADIAAIDPGSASAEIYIAKPIPPVYLVDTFTATGSEISDKLIDHLAESDTIWFGDTSIATAQSLLIANNRLIAQNDSINGGGAAFSDAAIPDTYHAEALVQIDTIDIFNPTQVGFYLNQAFLNAEIIRDYDVSFTAVSANSLRFSIYPRSSTGVVPSDVTFRRPEFLTDGTHTFRVDVTPYYVGISFDNILVNEFNPTDYGIDTRAGRAGVYMFTTNHNYDIQMDRVRILPYGTLTDPLRCIFTNELPSAPTYTISYAAFNTLYTEPSAFFISTSGGSVVYNTEYYNGLGLPLVTAVYYDTTTSTRIDINKPGYTQVVVYDTTTDGTKLVGAALNELTNETDSFNWTVDSGFTLMPDSSYTNTVATSVSDAGDKIVGFGRTSTIPGENGEVRQVAFMWTESDGYTPLGLLDNGGGYRETYAQAISGDGTTILGGSYPGSTEGGDADPNMQVWFKRNLGSFQTISPLGGCTNFRPKYISTDGSKMFGTAKLESGYDSVWRYQSGDEGAVAIPTAGFENIVGVYAEDATPDGSYVVGTINLSDGEFYGFYYDGETQILPSPSDATYYYQALSVSTDGQTIFGTAFNVNTQIGYAIMWQANNGSFNVDPTFLDKSVPEFYPNRCNADGTVAVGSSQSQSQGSIWTASCVVQQQ